MKTVKTFTLTAVALLGLGLAQAHADGRHAAHDGGPAAKATAPAAQKATVPAGHGVLSEAGALVSSPPRMEGVSAEFLAAIGKGNDNNAAPICVDVGCRTCCYAWPNGWLCAPTCP